jgi:hypothetical protein
MNLLYGFFLKKIIQIILKIAGTLDFYKKHIKLSKIIF